MGFKDAGKTSFVDALSSYDFLMEASSDHYHNKTTVPTLHTKVSTVRLNDRIITSQPEPTAGPNNHNHGYNSIRTPSVRSGTIGRSNVSIRSTSLKRTKTRTLSGVSEHQPLLFSPDSHDFNSPPLDSAELNGSIRHTAYEQEPPLIKGRPNIVLKIYDLSGHHKNQHDWNDKVGNSDGKSNHNLIIYMIDLSDYLSLDESRDKLVELLKVNNNGPRVPFMILFNKNDLVDDKELRFIQDQTKLRHQQLQEQQAQCNSASTTDSNVLTATTPTNGGGPSNNAQGGYIHGHRHSHGGKLMVTRGRRNSQASITASQKKSKSNSRWLLTKSRYKLLLDYVGLTQLPQNLSLSQSSSQISERGSFMLEQDKPGESPEELFFDVSVFIVSLFSDYSEGSNSLEDVVDWIVAC
ncbi:unnamed protein product [Ambrosiozyma monospora]|uniref:Unnamed protein product n=1 Tax=Ambrosiozyma monospora TaxID=43982 RepID=A0A9W6YXS5_AMBMO|nr:unnamed protein product [Ambrosiozyma monospora]